MWLLKLLSALALVYGAVVVAAFLLQTRMLFPSWMASPAGPVPASSSRLALVTQSGHSLSGIHIPSGRPAAKRVFVLAFAGNAWNADDAAMYLHDLYPEADVITFHYRGYPPSEGSPGAESLKSDALLIHDFVRERFGNPRMVVVGFSIGSGVAAFLAARRPLDGVILVSPFDSLTQVAAFHYPWLPVRLLFRHPMEAAADMRSVQAPVAVVSGDRDSVIPAARTQALTRAVPNLLLSRAIAGADHNDIYQDREFHSVMKDAFDRLLAR